MRDKRTTGKRPSIYDIFIEEIKELRERQIPIAEIHRILTPRIQLVVGYYSLQKFIKRRGL